MRRLALLGRPPGENVIGNMGGRSDAARRGAGLDQDRMALRRWNAVERAADLEEPARVIDRPHFARIGHDAELAVPDKSVRLDAVPQRAAYVDELFHPVIARAVLHQLVEAVIGGVGIAARCDDVEGDAAARDVIERVEQARHVERVHERRRIGQAEADMLGDARHAGDHRAHVVARPANSPAHRLVADPGPGVRDAGAVAEEQHVDAAALGDARDLFVDADVRVGAAGPRARHAPAAVKMRVGNVKSEVDFLGHGIAARGSSRSGLLIAPCAPGAIRKHLTYDMGRPRSYNSEPGFLR